MTSLIVLAKSRVAQWHNLFSFIRRNTVQSLLFPLYYWIIKKIVYILGSVIHLNCSLSIGLELEFKLLNIKVRSCVCLLYGHAVPGFLLKYS